MENTHKSIFALLLLIALSPLTLLGGCSNPPKKHLKSIVEPDIGYLDSKYRVCRENCPVRTPKVLDDAEYIPLTMPVPTLSPPPPKFTEMTFDIQFEFGKHTLTNEEKKTLELLTQSARSASSIELLGGTDDIGTERYNDKLAHSRVLFVASWLNKHGIDSKLISVVAKGACCRQSPYNKSEISLIKMRRVVARVVQLPKTQNK